MAQENTAYNALETLGNRLSSIVPLMLLTVTAVVSVAAGATLAAGYPLVSTDGGLTFAAANTPLFDAASTYAVGDKVVYGGSIYTCKTAIAAAAAWDETKWDLVGAYAVNGVLLEPLGIEGGDSGTEAVASVLVQGAVVTSRLPFFNEAVRVALFPNIATVGA